MNAKSFEEIRRLAELYTKTAFKEDIKDFSISFAKQDKGIWRVNVEFKEKDSVFLAKGACLEIDVKTGQLKAFYKDRVWRY